MDECEINRDGEWRIVGIAEALNLRGERMRCAACHGRVLPHTDYDDGAKPHFTHLVAFGYCAREAGIASPQHPDPLS